MLLQKKIEKRKRRRFQIGPATPGEVSGTKKRDIFLEKNPVKTVENYIFHCESAAISSAQTAPMRDTCDPFAVFARGGGWSTGQYGPGCC